MTWYSIKLPEKGWYAIKQNNQPTNQSIKDDLHLSYYIHFWSNTLGMYLANPSAMSIMWHKVGF